MTTTTTHTCSKRRYGSERSAKQKLRELRKRRRRQHATKVEHRAYQCELCGAWHLTSQPFEGQYLERP